MHIATHSTVSAAMLGIQTYGGALDIVETELRNGRIGTPLDDLFDDLSSRRAEDPETWKAYSRSCLGHPVCTLLHQDPFTYRAFSKPRGYAGDAVMMDYIYGLGEAQQAAREATPLGRAIFRYMDSRPAARGVRYRRELIARLIDGVAARGGSSVLAIAAGHLREIELSSATCDGHIRKFVAIDQDEASLAVVERDYSQFGVEPTPGTVRNILAGRLNPGRFDFVYAAGLFDYLSAPVAAALTARMFEMAQPGGVVLIPNFLPGVGDRGYMESFMDWDLIYRDHPEMEALVAALPAGDVAGFDVFNDPHGAITFLVVKKAY